MKQRFEVRFEYPVVFTRDVFAPSNAALDQAIGRAAHGRRRILAFLDDGLLQCRPDLPERLARYIEARGGGLELVRPARAVPGGEAVKNDYRLTMEIVDTILEYRLCRQSYVLAIGGGAVLDAVGFAASIVHRGLRLVRLPSTVLAQNDAGVGVKNGMNLHGGKNTIGTFHPPHAVIDDFDLLRTLSDVQWRDGISEAFKVAIIKDADFFDWLCAHAARLGAREEAAMETLIRRCAALHLEHIRTNGDPFELGTARPLDFGHWAAHKLESMSNYRISHGHAVAMGILLDSAYALEEGRIEPAEYRAIAGGLRDAGFPGWYPEMGRRLGDGSLELLQGLRDFQEHLGGRLCVTLPAGIGERREINTMDQALIERCVIRLCKEAAQTAPATPSNTRA